MVQDPVVVVGAGLGGLAAAVKLAQAGISVMVVEKEPRCGGYAVSFQRSGYTFDVALHAVPAAGRGDYFETLLCDLGVHHHVDFVRIPDGWHVRLGEKHYVLPNEPDRLFGYLSELFPAERAGLARLRRDIERRGALYYEAVEGRLSPWVLATRFVPSLPRFLRDSDLSAGRYLSSFVRDPVLQALLFQPAVFFGHTMAELPAINFLVMFYLLCMRGMYTVRGGGNALTRALEQRLRALGGDVRLGARIEKVLVRQGRAVGVRIAGDGEIPAVAVVSNVNTPTLIHELVGVDHFPSRYVSALSRVKFSLSVVELQVGLDCSLDEAGIGSYLTTVFPDSDIDNCMRFQRRERMPQGYSVTAYGRAAGELSSAPGAAISVVAAVNPDEWMNLPLEQYRKAKAECTHHLLSLLDHSFPGLRMHCCVCDLATPRTFSRYTGCPQGAIMGFASTLGVHRPLLTVSRIPIRNLYLAGAWTLRFGGMMQAIASGVAAARAVLRRDG